MHEKRLRIVLSEGLSLLVDKNIIEEILVITDDIGYCYPYPQDYELYFKLNTFLERIHERMYSRRDLYIVVYDIISGGSVVGFKLPKGPNVFLKLRRAEYSDIARKEIINLIERLRKTHYLLNDINDLY